VTGAALLGALALAQSTPLPQRFAEAFRAGDEAGMARVAARKEEDPYLVADWLFCSHLLLVLASPPKPSDLLDVAAAWAECTRDRFDGRGLAALVARWRSLDRAALEREGRIAGALPAARPSQRDAVRVFEAALGHAAPDDASLLVAKLRIELAEALRVAGRLADARVASLAACADCRKVGWPHGLALGLKDLGLVCFMLDRHGEARAAYEEALALLERIGDVRWTAACQANLAQILHDFEEFDGARALAERALENFQNLGDALSASQSRSVLGQALARLGRVDEGRTLVEQAIRELEEAGRRMEAASLRTNLAVLESEAGEQARSVRLFEEALAIQRKTGQLQETNVSNLATAYMYLGRWEDAEKLAREAVERARSAGERGDLGAALTALANWHQQVGRYAEALRLFEEAEPYTRARGLPRKVALLEVNLGLANKRIGDLPAAAKWSERARTTAAGARVEDVAAMASSHLGAVLGTQGRLDEAVARLQSALQTQLQLRDRYQASLTRARLARVHLLRDEPEDALRAAGGALEDLRLLARGLGEVEDSEFNRFAREAADFGMHAAAALPEGRREREAFRFAEEARGQGLTGLLVNRERLQRARLPAPLQEALSAARRRLETAQKRLRQASDADGDAARAAVDEAYAGWRDVVARVQREERAVADLTMPRPIALDAFQERVPAGAVALLYHVTETGSWVLAITRGEARLVPLRKADELHDVVRRGLRGADRGPAVEAAVSRELYNALLRPVEKLLGERDGLIVIPDAELAFLNFGTLLNETRGRPERVIERWQVTTVPSATVYASLLDLAGGRGEGIVALGDPRYPDPSAPPPLLAQRGFGTLDPLPLSGDEARAVAALYPEDRRFVLLGGDASAPSLRDALDRARGRFAAVHLACHGLLEPRLPRLVGLVLAGGELLALDDLYALRIPADLAVLSACQTSGGEVRRGEGVIGLVRAFFFAGCPRVVVSNRKVRDDLARDLMVAFHRAMREDGLAPGPALRAAQLAALRGGGDAAHPSSWGAFVLWGPGEWPTPTAPRPAPGPGSRR
jgi:CHAT domain-containing protein